MVIDKVEQLWTKKDTEKVQEIDQAIIKIYEEGPYINHTLEEEANDKLEALYNERDSIRDKLKEKYFISFKPKKARSEADAKKMIAAAILEDVREIVAALTKEDFLEHLGEIKEEFLRIYGTEIKTRTYGPDGKIEGENTHLIYLEEALQENWTNARNFIRSFLVSQIEALSYYGLETGSVNAEAGRKAFEWYPKQPSYAPVPYDKSINAFAMPIEDRSLDKIAGVLTLKTRDGVDIILKDFTDIGTSIGIGPSKLLNYALSKLIEQNERHTAGQNLDIMIPFDEYATLLKKYDLVEHIKPTPEEIAKEKKRVKIQRDNARRKIKADLDVLYNASLKWTGMRKSGSEAELRLLELKGEIKKDYIVMSFTRRFSKFALSLPLSQFPLNLIGVDERGGNVFRVGLKLWQHYNMDSNQEGGRNDILKVENILAVTDLPKFEDLGADKRHWERRIKDPLEAILDQLVKENVIKDGYEYTHKKKAPLNCKDIDDLQTIYEYFKDSYIHFTIVNPPDHTERLKRKAIRIEEAQREKKEKEEAKKKAEKEVNKKSRNKKQ